MRIIFTILSVAALIFCSYLELGFLWKILIQSISGILIILINISSVVSLSEARKSADYLRSENASLFEDANENRRNKERARKILGN